MVEKMPKPGSKGPKEQPGDPKEQGNQGGTLSRRGFLKLGGRTLAGAAALATTPSWMRNSAKAAEPPKGPEGEMEDIAKLESKLDKLYNILASLQNDAEKIFEELSNYHINDGKDIEIRPSAYSYMAVKARVGAIKSALKDVLDLQKNKQDVGISKTMKELKNMINQTLQKELDATSHAIKALETEPETEEKEKILKELNIYQEKLNKMFDRINK